MLMVIAVQLSDLAVKWPAVSHSRKGREPVKLMEERSDYIELSGLWAPREHGRLARRTNA